MLHYRDSTEDMDMDTHETIYKCPGSLVLSAGSETNGDGQANCNAKVHVNQT